MYKITHTYFTTFRWPKVDYEALVKDVVELIYREDDPAMWAGGKFSVTCYLDAYSFTTTSANYISLGLIDNLDALLTNFNQFGLHEGYIRFIIYPPTPFEQMDLITQCTE